MTNAIEGPRVTRPGKTRPGAVRALLSTHVVDDVEGPCERLTIASAGARDEEAMA